MSPENFVHWLTGYLELSEKITDRECKIRSALDKLQPLQFCYFLQGFYECSGYELTKVELIIKDHLNLVFNKITPDRVEIGIKNIIKDYKKSIEIKPFDYNINTPFC